MVKRFFLLNFLIIVFISLIQMYGCRVGDYIETSLSDGTIQVLYKKDGTITELKPDDGTIKIAQPDSTTIIMLPDGTITTSQKDGTKKTTTPDNSKPLTLPDGTVIEPLANRMKKITLPNGTTKEVSIPLDKVTVYFDASGSMKGYIFNGSPFIQNFVTRLVSQIGTKVANKTIKEIEFTSSSEGGTSITSVPDFLMYYNIQAYNHKSSLLHEDLSKIVETVKNNSVTLYITDGVLSHSIQDIIKNPEINRVQLPNIAGIAQHAFANLFNSGFACYILASKSDFKCLSHAEGVGYYDYRNLGHYNTTLHNRPYYLFIMGKDDDIAFFIKNVIEEGGYQYDQALIKNANMTSNALITVDNSMATNTGGLIGEWQYDPYVNTISISHPRSWTGGMFAFVLNLYKFVPIDSNLINAFSVNGASGVSVYSKDDFITQYAPNTNSGFYKNATHVVVAKFVTPPQGTCTIEYSNPKWYESWSTDDDTNVANIEGKTFGIKHLLDAVNTANSQKTKIASVTIKQD